MGLSGRARIGALGAFEARKTQRDKKSTHRTGRTFLAGLGTKLPDIDILDTIEVWVQSFTGPPTALRVDQVATF